MKKKSLGGTVKLETDGVLSCDGVLEGHGGCEEMTHPGLYDLDLYLPHRPVLTLRWNKVTTFLRWVPSSRSFI